MKTKFSGFLTLLLVLAVQIGFAQTKTVTGNVTDADGLPLPGVNILVKGTNTGTQSDFDGKYSIKASADQTLVFKYLGFKTQEIPVGSKSTVDVSMVVDAAELSEVVVVGYSTSTKQSFTGTAKKVDGDLLNRKNVSNVSQALAGEAAGVRVINTSGQPGSAAQVRIRGIGSVNGNTAPLYVVDGVIYNGSINAIDPNNIESTTVLKDAAATAVYGSRGANGVIVINTKRGSSEVSSIEVSTRTGYNFSLLPRYDVIDSPEQYIELGWEGLKNNGQYGSQNLSEQGAINYANNEIFRPGGAGIGSFYNMWNVADGSELIDPATGQVRDGVTRRYNPEDWEDYGFQTSNRTEANLRISGGNDKTTYFTSFGYLKDVGYIVDSDFERISGRLNLTHKAKDWLTGSMNVGYNIAETNNNGQSADSGSIFWFVDNIPSIYPLFLRDQAGDIVQDPIYGGPQYDYGEDGRRFGALTNSIADAYYSGSTSERQELNTNSYLKADITDNLSAEMRIGTQYFNNSFNSLQNPFYGPSAGQGGSIFKQKTELFSTNIQQIIRYGNKWGKHTLDAFAAHESNSWERQTLFISKNNLINPNGTELNNAVVVSSPPGSYVDNYTLESWFANANYNFDDTYYLSGTVRRDGSSRFLDDNKWGTFGSVGAAWVASNEDFMYSLEFVDFMKLKASYGLIGEQGGVGFYPGYTIYNIGNLNDNPSLSFNTRGNPDLTWETSKMFQTGIEATLFDNLIDINLDYYRKVTDDLLFDRRVPPSTGIALITVNDGQLLNSGFEFDINAHLVKTQDFFLDFTVNGEIVNNEFLEMPIDPATQEPKVLDQDGLYGRSEGSSIFDYYIREYAGVDAADGRSMWYQYFDDANSNGVLDTGEGILSMTEYLDENPDANIQRGVTKTFGDATQKYIGKSAIPDARGAFNIATGYKGFTLSAQFIYQIGGYSFDSAYQTLMGNDPVGGNNWHTDILGRWQEPGDVTNIPRISNDLDPQVNGTSDRFLVKSDFLALNNVRLAYNIPKKMLENTGIADLSLSLSGDNLFLLSERDGFNPSTSITGGSDQYRYSPLSTFTVGVNLKF
jgi:TonB-linked SusC/RagA family outer membrane protein